MTELVVGFSRFDAYKIPTGAAQMPAPGSWQTVTIGGPRTLNQVQDELAACRKKIEQPEAELLRMVEHQP